MGFQKNNLLKGASYLFLTTPNNREQPQFINRINPLKFHRQQNNL